MGATHSWFFKFTLNQSVTGGTIGDDVGFADDARGLHSNWLKNSLLQEISVELSGNVMN